MSSRGRGFTSRGSSYRGRGGSDWNNSSNSGSRGGYSSSRGRFNKYSTPSYEPRNKYSSDSGRYSSRGSGRGDHSNSYKRPRDSYSSRDDHRSSSDSSRKRIRNDSYQGSGGGSQRYYGGSSVSGYDDSKRSSSGIYEDKRQNDRTSSYHRQDERHSAPRNYSSQASGRSSDITSGARYTPNRGRANNQSTGYRGRSSRGNTRGFRLGSRSDALSSRKRTLSTLEYRRKMIGTRSRDYVQRVRMTTKMRRSSGTIRLSGSKKETGSSAASMKDKMAKAINAEFSDDDDEDKSNWDDDDKPLDRDDDDEDDEDDDGDQEEKKSKEDKRKKEDEDLKKDNSDEEVDKNDEMQKDDEEEEEQKNEADNDEERNKEDDKSVDANRSGSEELPSRRDGKRYIKLNCPHCIHRSVTFKEYQLHLYSGRHTAAMRRVAARRKAELARMRVIQREEQKRIEAKDESRGTLPSRTLFCHICKLNYRSLKAMHQLSESHRQMKKFLTPFCRICRTAFRSPMLYETHLCSLDHIKRKSIMDERRHVRNGRNDESSGGEEDDKEVNLDNFMTLDSVGDVDEEDEEAGEKKKKDGSTEAVSSESQDKKAKTKQMIKVGAEFIKRIEVHFCDLCKAYLPNNENTERAIALHCSTRSHLRRYVRNNDDRALRREAERIHLQSSTATGNATFSNSTVNSESTSANGDQHNASKDTSRNDETNTNADNMTTDNQNLVSAESNTKIKKRTVDEEDDDDYREDNNEALWDDKDINDEIEKGETGAKSSDDEDSRYDRFRNSEKKLKEKEKNEDKKSDDKESGSKTDVKIKGDKPEK